MAKKPKPLSEQIRQAILDAPITRYRLAKISGVTEGQLSKFVNRKNSLTLDTIDMIGQALELSVVSPPQTKGT